jgi:hypothetical protein
MNKKNNFVLYSIKTFCIELAFDFKNKI